MSDDYKDVGFADTEDVSYGDVGFEGFEPGGEIGFEEEAVEPVPRPTDEASLERIFGKFAMEGVCNGGFVTLPEPVGRVQEIRVHTKVRGIMENFLRDVHREGYWWMIRSIEGYIQKVRPSSRRYKELRKVSLQSWGIALSINADYNQPGERIGGPHGEPILKTQKGEPGYSFYEGHPIVEIAKRHKLQWAGVSEFPVLTTDGDEFVENDVPLPSVFMYMTWW